MKKLLNRHTLSIKAKQQLRLSPGYFMLVLWLVFCLVTIGWIIIASLSTTREIFTNTMLSSGLHFDTYAKVWKENNITRYFINSVIYSVSSCAGVIFVAAPAAYTLGRKVFRGRKTLINFFLISMCIPVIMIAIPLFSILVRAKMTDSIATLIVIYIISLVPFTVFFLISFFATLPGELDEAARVDGCSHGGIFWRIYLPLAQPGILTVTIFNFMNIWNEYFMALIFSTKSEIRPLSVGLQSIIQSMRFTGNWSGLFAAVVIVFMPTFLLYLILSDRIIMGVTGGAVKG